MWEVKRTNRGFEVIDFKDCNEEDCSLQQSSVWLDDNKPGQSAIWLGIGASRMHLNLEQVETLINHLQSWEANGSFDPGKYKRLD